MTFLSFFILSLASPAWAEVCEVNFSRFSAVSGRDLSLKTGEPASITIKSPEHNQKISAFFVGRSADRSRIYFTDKRGTIFSLEAGSAKIQDKKGNQLFLHSEKNSRVTEISVEKQKYEDCAVHSTVNCVLFLRNEGLLPDDSFINAAGRSILYSLFEGVDASYLEGRVAQANRANQASGRGVLGNLFFGARAETQISLRQRLLAKEGIPSRQISSRDIKPILRHLESGMPVILDLPVKIESQPLVQISTNGQRSSEGIMSAPSRHGSESIGSHSVVAIGIVKTGWFARRIAVVDSLTGRIAFWNAADLKKSQDGAATLVFPDDYSLKKAFPKN